MEEREPHASAQVIAMRPIHDSRLTSNGPADFVGGSPPAADTLAFAEHASFKHPMSTC